ncbi:MAG: M48 family metalloprotease [Elusimicrobiota bacterium]
MKQPKGRMKIILLGMSLIYLSGCATVPLIGRKQMNFIPSSQMSAMGTNNYRSFISGAKLSKDAEKTAMINRVGRRISAASEMFLKETGRGSDIKYYEWEYNLVDDDKTVNAWAMPGGKIVFYTGILKLAETEDEIAVITGHEQAVS